jgi:hypothetical protein
MIAILIRSLNWRKRKKTFGQEDQGMPLGPFMW